MKRAGFPPIGGCLLFPVNITAVFGKYSFDVMALHLLYEGCLIVFASHSRSDMDHHELETCIVIIDTRNSSRKSNLNEFSYALYKAGFSVLTFSTFNTENLFSKKYWHI
ncbi:hypothetical protein [[Clostridium] aminophilum]|uniref:hypothetical protein n=1 Tax=[Clostridium] aminophilum TaxID=1526 RepID=UPI001A9A5FFC|nr:hypothetical protein [[Clostridium] aminophilum]